MLTYEESLPHHEYEHMTLRVEPSKTEGCPIITISTESGSVPLTIEELDRVHTLAHAFDKSLETFNGRRI